MTTLNLSSENKPRDLMMYDFNIVLIDMDTMVGESIFKNRDGSFSIFINTRWSAEEQRRCVLHAFDHVRHHDWEKSSVQEIEYEAHRREK